MKLSKIILALGIATVAVTGTHAVAAKFDASRNGAAKQVYSKADHRKATAIIKANKAGGGGGLLRTDSYCVWKDAAGKWHVKKVDLLTVCIDSIKVTCNDGICSAD